MIDPTAQSELDRLRTIVASDHWGDCAVNHGGTVCDMGAECGMEPEERAQRLVQTRTVRHADLEDQLHEAINPSASTPNVALARFGAKEPVRRILELLGSDAGLLRNLIRQLMSDHPLPWRIDHDWTLEVIDAKGLVVTKGMDLGQASRLIAIAENVAANNPCSRRNCDADRKSR